MYVPPYMIAAMPCSLRSLVPKPPRPAQVSAAVGVPLVFHVVARRDVGMLRLPVLCVVYPAYLGAIAGTLVCWAVQGKLGV
mgnify:CR=1 FL=1